MRPIVAAVLAAGLGLAVPAAAHDFKHHHRSYGYPGHPVPHHWHHPPAWGHWKKQREVHHHYYYHYPPAVIGVPRPGVHVIFPDIYVPWPK
ncbi:MAG TPA: hypothetical protein VNK67_02640 [Burkholderiales bacterium]|nr:hypothetical protein [Burkholderiales bacterium]